MAPAAPLTGLQFLQSLGHEWKSIPALSLSAVSTVLAYLGNPQDQINCIHIAGTNGKGSVSAATAAILAQTGAKVGLTISPHLTKLNERIILDGLAISDDLLDYYAQEIARVSSKVDVTLSFFEALIASAFLAFKQEQVDWAVLEVGLGGRLDATNVLKSPRIGAIVSIDFDHEHILGDTLAKIAREKAGIVKQGRPMVLGQMTEAAKQVIKAVCREFNAPVDQYGRDFWIEQSGNTAKVTTTFANQHGDQFEFEQALSGEHQAYNMAVAIQMMRKLEISTKHCAAGVGEVFWPARLEHIDYGLHKFIFDCAHNPAGISSLVAYLKANNLNNLRCCFGALVTKNWKQMLHVLMPYVTEWNIVEPSSERALGSDRLVAFLSGNGVRVNECGKNYAAIAHQLKQPSAFSTTLFCGSMYMVGQMRPYFINEERPIWTKAAEFNSKLSLTNTSVNVDV